VQGYLGNGTTREISTWTKVMDDVADVDAAGFHALVLKAEGTVWEA